MTENDTQREPLILLIEDNPGDVLLIEEALQEIGSSLSLQSVRDGEAALAFLHRRAPYHTEESPTLVLLDLNLPRMNGLEVLRCIREDERLHTLPVIILTTSEAPEDVERAYALQANAYVTKPANLDALFHMVKVLEHFWFSIARLPAR
jgi:CheY-like chemotaxis protein